MQFNSTVSECPRARMLHVRDLSVEPINTRDGKESNNSET